MSLEVSKHRFIARTVPGTQNGLMKVQSLLDHLTEVGELSEQYATKVNLGLPGKILGLLHDFGKYSENFQTYIRKSAGIADPDNESWERGTLERGRIDHSTAGAQYLWKRLKEIGKKRGQGELVGQILALCIASHHSGLIDCLSVDGRPTFRSRIEKSSNESNYSNATENADAEFLVTIDKILSQTLVESVIAQIGNIYREFGSNSNKPSIQRMFAIGMLTRFLFSCLVDADRTNSAEFASPRRKKDRQIRSTKYRWEDALARFHLKLESFSKDRSIDNLRKRISDVCFKRARDPQGIYTLSVPTGGGKTLASLRYAMEHARIHHLERIVYVIPYTSIIDQNAKVAREFIEPNGEANRFSWIHEHHSNLDPKKENVNTKIISENWDAPIVFTTMVQFLNTLFSSGTRNVRRLHQLAKAVIIFDEIQTLPINCVHMFCNATNFLSKCAHTTVVMSSATQPLLHKLENTEFGELQLDKNSELAPDVEQLYQDLSRCKIVSSCKPEGWNSDEIVALIYDRYQQYSNCLTVVNTRGWARKIFELLSTKVSNDELFHLSTNQCKMHRNVVLQRVLSRLRNNLRTICISTQLIEAGVDVDFNAVVRFLAGLDSIVQSAGRCNRHGLLEDGNGNKVRGVVEVVNPNEENLEHLVDIRLGAEKSKWIFREFKDEELLQQEAMNRYFEYFFFERRNEMCYPISAINTNILRLLSDNENNVGVRNDWEAAKCPLLEQSFMEAGRRFEAIDTPSESVIVPYGKGGKELISKLCKVDVDTDIEGMSALLREAQSYSVNLFSWEWEQLKEEQALTEVQENLGIYYLHEEYYDDEFGVSMKNKGIYIQHDPKRLQ